MENAIIQLLKVPTVPRCLTKSTGFGYKECKLSRSPPELLACIQ